MTDLPALKAQLATAVRLLYREGLMDYNGHVSVRVDDHVLINPRPISRAIVQAQHIVAIDLRGKFVEGDYPQPSESALHTAIYRARNDVVSVAHLHSHYATTLSIAGQPIVPVYTLGCIFADGVPVFDDPDLIRNDDQGDAVAETLGSARAALLRGHGSIVTGASIEETFVASVYFEENARKQYDALRIGSVRAFTDDESRRLLKSLWQPITAKKVWDFYVSTEETSKQ